jgi:hypothetical protein
VDNHRDIHDYATVPLLAFGGPADVFYRDLRHAGHRQWGSGQIPCLDGGGRGSSHGGGEAQAGRGSCPNIACLPCNNIIHSAKVRSFTMRAAEFGVEMNSAVKEAVSCWFARLSNAQIECISHKKIVVLFDVSLIA